VEQERCDRAELHARLAAAVREDAARPLLLKGDARLAVRDVRGVLAIAREAGARGVRLAVERREEH
jgi:biopolymer transport protein ExbD